MVSYSATKWQTKHLYYLCGKIQVQTPQLQSTSLPVNDSNHTVNSYCSWLCYTCFLYNGFGHNYIIQEFIHCFDIAWLLLVNNTGLHKNCYNYIIELLNNLKSAWIKHYFINLVISSNSISSIESSLMLPNYDKKKITRQASRLPGKKTFPNVL